MATTPPSEGEGRDRGLDAVPPPQYVSAEHVLDTMGRAGVRRIKSLSVIQVLVLGVVGGAFITVGALFSVLLASGVHSPGPQRLLEGQENGEQRTDRDERTADDA